MTELVSHLLGNVRLFRAIRTKRWLDESGRILPDAFIRDPKRDPDGLSVGIGELLQTEASLHEWLTRILSDSFGFDVLRTSPVRAVGLQVGQTQEDVDQSSAHALIVGIPSPDEDPQRAEDIASALVDASTPGDRLRRKRK